MKYLVNIKHNLFNDFFYKYYALSSPKTETIYKKKYVADPCASWKKNILYTHIRI